MGFHFFWIAWEPFLLICFFALSQGVHCNVKLDLCHVASSRTSPLLQIECLLMKWSQHVHTLVDPVHMQEAVSASSSLIEVDEVIFWLIGTDLRWDHAKLTVGNVSFCVVVNQAMVIPASEERKRASQEAFCRVQQRWLYGWKDSYQSTYVESSNSSKCTRFSFFLIQILQDRQFTVICRCMVRSHCLDLWVNPWKTTVMKSHVLLPQPGEMMARWYISGGRDGERKGSKLSLHRRP